MDLELNFHEETPILHFRAISVLGVYRNQLKNREKFEVVLLILYMVRQGETMLHVD